MARAPSGPTPVVTVADTPEKRMAFPRKFHNGVMLPNGELLVVDSLDLAEIKTKALAAKLKALGAENALVVIPEQDTAIENLFISLHDDRVVVSALSILIAQLLVAAGASDNDVHAALAHRCSSQIAMLSCRLPDESMASEWMPTHSSRSASIQNGISMSQSSQRAK